MFEEGDTVAVGTVITHIDSEAQALEASNTASTGDSATSSSPTSSSQASVQAHVMPAAARILVEKGELLWEWVVHENDLNWRLIANAERKFPHGVLVDNDASLTFAFDNGNSLQKFDRCSKRVWAEKAKVDHNLSLDHEGKIWAVMGPDSVGQFDPKTGKRLRRINMKRLMKKNPEIDPLGIRQVDSSKGSRFMTKGGGYWHPNDAEPLPKAYAEAFPQFEVGDLLVSLRSLNLIFIFSPKDLKIKWWKSGAWRRQHDPDWHSYYLLFAQTPL